MCFSLINDFFLVDKEINELRLEFYSCFGLPVDCKSTTASGTEFRTQCKIDKRIARSNKQLNSANVQQYGHQSVTHVCKFRLAAEVVERKEHTNSAIANEHRKRDNEIIESSFQVKATGLRLFQCRFILLR